MNQAMFNAEAAINALRRYVLALEARLAKLEEDSCERASVATVPVDGGTRRTKETGAGHSVAPAKEQGSRPADPLPPAVEEIVERAGFGDLKPVVLGIVRACLAAETERLTREWHLALTAFNSSDGRRIAAEAERDEWKARAENFASHDAGTCAANAEEAEALSTVCSQVQGVLVDAGDIKIGLDFSTLPDSVRALRDSRASLRDLLRDALDQAPASLWPFRERIEAALKEATHGQA